MKKMFSIHLRCRKILAKLAADLSILSVMHFRISRLKLSLLKSLEVFGRSPSVADVGVVNEKVVVYAERLGVMLSS